MSDTNTVNDDTVCGSGAVPVDDCPSAMLSDLSELMSYVRTNVIHTAKQLGSTAHIEYQELKQNIQSPSAQMGSQTETPVVGTSVDSVAVDGGRASDVATVLVEQLEHGVDNVLNQIESSIDTVESKLHTVGESLWNHTTTWFTLTLHTLDAALDGLAGSTEADADADAVHAAAQPDWAQLLSIEPSTAEYEKYAQYFDGTVLPACINASLQQAYQSLVPNNMSALQFWCRYTYLTQPSTSSPTKHADTTVNQQSGQSTVPTSNHYDNSYTVPATQPVGAAPLSTAVWHSESFADIPAQPLKHTESSSSIRSWVSVSDCAASCSEDVAEDDAVPAKDENAQWVKVTQPI